MEIEKEGKKEKKKLSFFCCFSTNCTKSSSRKKNTKNKRKVDLTTGIKSTNSIQNNSKSLFEKSKKIESIPSLF